MNTLSFMSQKLVLPCLLAVLSVVPNSVLANSNVVNIYSARKEALILPLLKRFKQETGIHYRLVTGKADGLLKRLELEGKHSPADIFITVDAGRLQRAKEADVLQALDNEVLQQKIPVHLRDKDNYWFGMSQRARTIVYAKDRVKPGELSTYEALADAKWKGRICIRSSSNIYNQSLVASMLKAKGVEVTEAWAKGLVANFARPPSGGDTGQLKAVAAGQCDVTVVNTYYVGRLLNSPKAKDQAVMNKLAVFWPNQGKNQRGVHVNVSGVGITKYAKNLDAATRLLEFMVTDESQKWYAEVNNEYPVVAHVGVSDTLKSIGDFKADSVNLTALGENNRAAVKLMDRAGWR